jgi:hypothetical protein
MIIKCGKLEGGKIEFGTLKETGPEDDTENETIKIGNHEYDKEQVEEALKNIKAIKYYN